MPPGVWQPAHLLAKIGATLFQVGADVRAAGPSLPEPPAAIAATVRPRRRRRPARTRSFAARAQTTRGAAVGKAFVSASEAHPASRLLLTLVKRLGVLVAVALALALTGGKGAPAQQLQANCSLFGKAPLWLDFADGSVPFWSMFAKPGVTALASNFIYPPKLRAGGAQTAYFDLYLNRRVGTTSKPADPATIVDKANKFYEYAAQAMDCSNPVIAENELFGSWLAVPWSATNAQYRSNVLLFLQTLRQRGAQPWLLVNAKPYTDGTAGDWWRQVADVAGIVREVYFPAPLIYKQGPDSRKPHSAPGVPERHPRLHEGGNSRVEARHLPRLPDDEGQRRTRGSRGGGLVPYREMAGACGPLRGQRDEVQLDLVLGLGGVEDDARRDGSCEAAGCVRLPVGSEPEPLQRPAGGREGIRALAHRRPADPVTGSALSTRTHRSALVADQSDPEADRRPRARVLERVCAGRRATLGAGQLRRHPCRGAFHHQRRLRWLARRVSCGDRRRAHESLRRAGHHRRRVASRADREQVQGVCARAPARSRTSTRRTAICRLAWSRRSRGRRGSAGAARATRSSRPRRPS